MLDIAKLRNPFIWFASLAVLVELALFGLCVWGLVWQEGIPVNLGWAAQPIGDSWSISEIAEKGPAAAKLQIGDQLVSIDGSERAAHFGPSLLLREHSRRTYSVEVSRSGKHVLLLLRPWRQPEEAWRYYCYLLLALINLLIAVWIGLARPDYGAAQVAFFLFMETARTFAAAFLSSFPPYLAGASLWLAVGFMSHVWQSLGFAVAYDFALRFPQTMMQSPFLRLLRWFFYSAAILLFVICLFHHWPTSPNCPPALRCCPGGSLSLLSTCCSGCSPTLSGVPRCFSCR